MSKRSITLLSWLAGALLALAGVTFAIMMPTAGDPVEQAGFMMQHRSENFIYVASVFFSSVLITPVIIMLSIRLYVVKSTGIIAGTMLILAVILESVATLASLSRWAYAIPGSIKGDPLAIKTFETLQILYLGIDFPGVLLFYISAIIYGFIFWNMHRASSLLLFVSTATFLIGGGISFAAPGIGMLLSGISIIFYGLAYISLGKLTTNLT